MKKSYGVNFAVIRGPHSFQDDESRRTMVVTIEGPSGKQVDIEYSPDLSYCPWMDEFILDDAEAAGEVREVGQEYIWNITIEVGVTNYTLKEIQREVTTFCIGYSEALKAHGLPVPELPYPEYKRKGVKVSQA